MTLDSDAWRPGRAGADSDGARMDDPQLRRQLEQVVQDEDLFDPSWVLALDELDEPPLFTTCAQVEFLSAVPEDDRGVLLLSVGVKVLDAIVAQIEAAEVPPSQKYFVALTVTDWIAFASGECSVPTVAVLVDPHDERNTSLPLLAGEDSRWAARVRGWLRQSKFEGRFQVLVDTLDEEDDLFRVYVVPS